MKALDVDAARATHQRRDHDRQGKLRGLGIHRRGHDGTRCTAEELLNRDGAGRDGIHVELVPTGGRDDRLVDVGPDRDPNLGAGNQVVNAQSNRAGTDRANDRRGKGLRRADRNRIGLLRRTFRS